MERVDTHHTGTVESLPTVITEDFLRALREHGIVRASLFGSVARGDDRPDSDIDLLVTFDRPVSLFERMRIARRLAAVCGRPVDLMTRIHPALEPYIIPTLIPLPV